MKGIIAAGITLCLLVPPMEAQDEGKKHERHHKLWELLLNVSPADREKYRTARKQAMANPEVAAAAERRKKANVEYHKLLRREMLKIDPSLAPLLDKLSELRSHDDL
jgi:hypothetical protein